MDLTFLSWDSEFFSKKIYKLSVERELTTEELFSLQTSQADLIYIFVMGQENKFHETLQKLGAKLYDRKITYRKRFAPTDVSMVGFSFQSVLELTPAITQMAYQSGAFSRFKKDPKLANKFEELYYKWIFKSIQREIADEVIVAKKGSLEVGFITLSNQDDTGKIGLIAVDPNFRGLSVASHLLHKAERWFSKKNILEFEVITQLDNIPACSLYIKNGFTPTKIEYIYHFWK